MRHVHCEFHYPQASGTLEAFFSFYPISFLLLALWKPAPAYDAYFFRF